MLLANTSLTDNVPLIDSSTTDRLFTQRLSIQLITVKFVMTASLAVRFSTVIFSANSSLTDSVPLTDPSITDKFSTHKLVMQFVTVRFSTVASFTDKC